MVLSPINIVQIAIAGGALSVAGMVILDKRALALALLLATFGSHMALNFLEETDILAHGFLITPAMGALYAPLVFLMTRGLVMKGGALRRGDAVHMGAALLALLTTPVLSLARGVVVISTLAYIVATILLIRRHHRISAELRSDVDQVRLNWVFGIFAAFAALTIVDGFRMATMSSQSLILREFFYAGVLIAAAGLFGILTVRSLQYRKMFEGADHQKETSSVLEEPLLAEDDFAGFGELRARVIDRQLFLEPHVTLNDIANATTLTEREISRLINGAGGRTFNDFINGLRARHVAQALKDPAHDERGILEIALDSGFTSKSTFNAAFKKELGMTPSAWRRRAAVQESENTMSDDETQPAS